MFWESPTFWKRGASKTGMGWLWWEVNTGGGKPGQRREWRSGDANCGSNANCATKNLSKGGVEKSAKSANIVSVGSPVLANSEHKHVHCIHICNTSTTPTHPNTGPAHYTCTICIAVQCTEYTFTQRVCLTLVCITVYWVHQHTEGIFHTCLSQCCMLQACCMCNTDNTEALSSLLENCVRRKSNTAKISLCCQWWRLRELGFFLQSVTCETP